MTLEHMWPESQQGQHSQLRHDVYLSFHAVQDVVALAEEAGEEKGSKGGGEAAAEDPGTGGSTAQDASQLLSFSHAEEKQQGVGSSSATPTTASMARASIGTSATMFETVHSLDLTRFGFHK